MTHAIEVRNEGGLLEIPGAAEVEDWHAVLTELEGEPEDYGVLRGWEPWQRLVRIVDRDGRARWYMVR